MDMKLNTLRIIIMLFLISSGLLLTLSFSASNTAASRAPEILFASPKDREDVPLNAEIVITFNEDMRQAETEQAFSITPHIEGKISLLDKTVTFTPHPNFEPGIRYTYRISTSAQNLAGENLAEEQSWSFTTVTINENDNQVDNKKDTWWDKWEPIITGGTIIATALGVLIGFYSLRRKRRKLGKYIQKLDNTYNEYRKDPHICEHKLNQLKEWLKIKVGRGKLDEYHYLILDKKIDDYLAEVRYRKTLAKPKVIAGVEKEIQEELKKKTNDQTQEKTPERKEDRKEQPTPKAPPKPKKPPKPRIIADN